MAKDNTRQLKRKVRSSYAISTVSVALVLFLIGTMSYLIVTAISATDRMKESFTVNVMLRQGVAKEDLEGVGARLANHPSVKQAVLVTRDEAAEEFRQYIGSDFKSFLGTNPLPDSYRVSMRTDHSDKASLEAFETEVKAWSGVDELVYQRTVMEQINANIRKFIWVLALFGGGLMVISVVLLRNTIRAAIYSRRYIINTMKLVGATRGFILRPFVRKAAVQGIYAALIAGAMFLIMVAGLHEGLPNMTLMLRNTHLAAILGAMLAGGILISVTFTMLSVNKFINMNSKDIHLY